MGIEEIRSKPNVVDNEEIENLLKLKKLIDDKLKELPSMEWIDQRLEMIDELITRGLSDLDTVSSTLGQMGLD